MQTGATLLVIAIVIGILYFAAYSGARRASSRKAGTSNERASANAEAAPSYSR